MRGLVEMAISGDNDDSVLFEVDVEDQGLTRAARPGEVVARIDENLRDLLAQVRPMIGAIGDTLRATGDADEVVVEFGMNAAVTGGVIIAQSSMQANLKVTLQWHR